MACVTVQAAATSPADMLLPFTSLFSSFMVCDGHFKTRQLLHAAPHGKAGSTKEPRLADRNQQNLPPHQLLMHWVWDHFSEGSGFDSTGSIAKGSAPESSSSAQPKHSSSAVSSDQMAAPSDRTASQAPYQQSSAAAGSSAQQRVPAPSVFRSGKSAP